MEAQLDSSKTDEVKKKIIIISLNYSPEETAIGLYSTQMSEFLVNKGWEVKVITGFPYYPQWEIYNEYKGKSLFYREVINGVEVFRYKQYVPASPKLIKRILQIIDFTLGSLANLRKIKRADVVLSVIPFTSSAWLGKRLTSKLNSRHWIHIQDFEFDAAFEAGLLRKNSASKQLASILSTFEKNILCSADIVSSISNAMLKKIREKTSSTAIYFPNWVDEMFINPKNALPHIIFDSTKFNILYSGNIGGKQDWDLFLEIIKYFQGDHSIVFSIVGDGAMKENLKSRTQHFRNVNYYPPVPYSELNNLLCSADLHILFQKEEVMDSVMPSKVLAMMASSVPSIITGNKKSETSVVLNKAKGGYYFSAKEKLAICEKIEKIKSKEDLREEIGSNARSYILEHFTKTNVLEKFNSDLEDLIKLNEHY